MDEVRVRSERAPGPRQPEAEPGADKTKPPGHKPRPGRGGLKFVLWILAGGLLLFGLYRFLSPATLPGQRHETAASAAPQPVGAGAASKGDIRIIVNALGTVTPLATVTVKTQINGQLTEVGFKEGQIVKKGDFLAQIDQRPYQLALAQYEGQLAHDQGALGEAKMDMIRYENLAKEKAVSRQIYEDQVYAVQQDEGTVKTDQALIDTEKLNLIYCHIVSPVNGRIGLRLVDPGNYVQTTDAGIAVVTQLQPISVILPVPEDNIPEIMAQLGAGQTLQVMVYDRADVTLLDTGKVTNIDSQIDTTTGTLKLRAEFNNSDLKLFPNQFVNAKLVIRTLHNVVTAPVTAVRRGGTWDLRLRDQPQRHCLGAARQTWPSGWGQGGGVVGPAGWRARCHRWRRQAAEWHESERCPIGQRRASAWRGRTEPAIAAEDWGGSGAGGQVGVLA